ncbi:MAG: hypothetical protein ACLS8S_01750 [Oscillospiraceae bacterium]
MVLDGTLPARVSHLRIGEFALLGGIYGCYPDFCAVTCSPPHGGRGVKPKPNIPSAS